jgi:hypothetical protein
MRMMLKIMIPTEAGNRTIKDGSLPKILEGAVARLKAEAAYFVAEDGVRTAMIFFDMRDSSDIPSIVEPLFMGIDADPRHERGRSAQGAEERDGGDESAEGRELR